MSDEWVVTMPKLGETVTEGTIGSWRKQVGETVEFDDPLFEVSTDKVDSEIPSPYDGVIVEIMVGEGETVPVGTPLVRIGARGLGARSGRTGCPRRRTGWPRRAVRRSTTRPTRPWAAPRARRAPTPRSGCPAGVVHDITMPKLGETVTEGTIGSWRKQVGDTVEFDDPLFEVSTDKVDSEIPSPYDGVMLEILVGEGETVPVGTVLARIGEPGATAAPAPSATPASGGAAAACRRTGRPGDGGRARGRRPQRPDALAAGAPPRGGVRARRRRDHRFRRGRPDPARGRGARDRRGHGPGAGTCRRRPGTCRGSGACRSGGPRARCRPGRARGPACAAAALPRPVTAATRS